MGAERQEDEDDEWEEEARMGGGGRMSLKRPTLRDEMPSLEI